MKVKKHLVFIFSITIIIMLIHSGYSMAKELDSSKNLVSEVGIMGGGSLISGRISCSTHAGFFLGGGKKWGPGLEASFSYSGENGVLMINPTFNIPFSTHSLFITVGGGYCFIEKLKAFNAGIGVRFRLLDFNFRFESLVWAAEEAADISLSLGFFYVF